MKHILFTFVLFFFGLRPAPAQSRGDLAADTLLFSLDKSAILDIYAEFGVTEFLFPIQYDRLELHRIAYYTPNGRGDSLTLASGLVTFPLDTVCPFPLLNYNHGSLAYDEALSELKAKMNQHYIGVPFAATGYIVALPDLLGYGATPVDHPHPYVHAKSEATAVVDMLRATRQLCSAYQVQRNDQLFLLGYSQGGHTTMATHRELQTLHAGEFTVTASAPCSGPYDLSGILRDSMFHSQTFSNPFFIAFATLSYQYVYQNLYDEIGDIFQPPWDSLILRMLDRRTPESQLRDSLPVPGYQMFQPDYLAEVLADSLHPMNAAIRDNNLYDWRPDAPVRLYYCTQDEQIPFINALFTANYMSDLGADVTAYNAGPFDHFGCTPFALLSAKVWFDGLRTSCPVGTEALAGAEPLRCYPNPFQSAFALQLNTPGEAQLRLCDLSGRAVYEGAVRDRQPVALPAGLPPGLYLAEVLQGGTRGVVKVVKED